MIRALIFAALVGVAASASKCDKTAFSLCQNSFNAYLGIDNAFDWTKPVSLAVQIQNIYINGATTQPKQKGLVSVCNAYNSLLQCLYKNSNGYNPKDCFDPLWLIQNDKTPYDAYAYAGLMNMVQYQCGAGFYTAVDNWQCLQTVYQNQNATLHGCLNSFFINARTNPQGACDYFKTGMECYQGAFRHCHDDMTYYGCESFRVIANAEYYGCQENCRVQGRFGEAGVPMVKSERFAQKN